MADLKLCPFCGGEVDLEHTADSREWWGVVCRNTSNRGGTCAIQIRPSASKEAAIERWNRRANLQAAKPEQAQTAVGLPEPFGYFRCTLDGWVDCAETDEGARPLYEYSEIAKRDAEIDEVAIALSETNVARMRLIDELTTLRAQLQTANKLAQASIAFINSHAADPDITHEMCEKYAIYQEALATYQSTQGQLK